MKIIDLFNTIDCKINIHDCHYNYIGNDIKSGIAKRFSDCEVLHIAPCNDHVIDVMIDAEDDTAPLNDIVTHINRTMDIMNDCDNLTTAKEELITGLHIMSENIDLIIDNLEHDRDWNYGLD